MQIEISNEEASAILNVLSALDGAGGRLSALAQKLRPAAEPEEQELSEEDCFVESNHW